MKKTLIWLDDLRNPFKSTWIAEYSPIGEDVDVIWIKNYKDFCMHIEKFGLPDAICFDHDLGNSALTGKDCANFVINYCITNHVDIPRYSVQSSNPVGKKNIISIMDNYHNFFINKTK